MKNKNTTGSVGHDRHILSRMMKQRTTGNRKKKIKSGYIKHKNNF